MPTDLEELEAQPNEVALWQNAQQAVLSGQHDRALATYDALIQRFPSVAQLWFELGIAAAGDLDFARADQTFHRAVELAANDVSLLVLLGQQYHRIRRLDQARACFERAVAADPSSVHARLSLAAWLERERRLNDAWECIEACIARHPTDDQAHYFRAFLLHRQGRNEEAERVLRGLIKGGSHDPNVHYSSRHLLGVVLDELGRYSEALWWLIEAKSGLRQMTNTAQLEEDFDRSDSERRALLAGLTPEAVQRWRQEGPAVPCDFQLALLGGHPRSGTTLLERILGAHPDVLAFDEPEAFVLEVWNQLAPMPAARGLTANELNALAPDRRAELGRRYLKSLFREVQGEPCARLLLDKNPSPTMALHLWLRVFPNLKVIIALRDPRDVLISCFFQNLPLTPASVNFLSLERTARHYASLMDVWLRMRELGGFDWIETRYEDVVANIGAEGRRVTEFAGLPWHAEQANPHEGARRKQLYAPTYDAVTKPVHNRAVGRWRNYEKALAPIQEQLAPYCRAFGYAS